MAKKSQLPRLSRVDFYRFNEGELIFPLAQAIIDHTTRHPAVKLTANQKALSAWARMSTDVLNGGFTQFFFNHRGDRGVDNLADLLDTIALPKAATVIRDAVALYRQHKREFRVDNPWDGLFGSIPEFDKLDQRFSSVVLRGNRALEKWIRTHIKELATDELGQPIDSQFTGSVEIALPNGLVSEYLEVKKGRPHGAYRRFYDDGTVRQVVFYRSGKVTGDFWPTGQLKRKESKRGKQTVIEWYYPSGRLHKRYVKDKDGYAAEPVQLFHENGQLAEELHLKEGDRFGPWLKFFDDGTPQLQAKYAANEKLIVQNAWNPDRQQVVKKGTGVFYDDAQTIDWAYDVFFQGNWQTETELKAGIPHGKQTTYHDHVLWSVSHFQNGVRSGKSTTYWDNGRVRTESILVRGKETKSKSFPKFDVPVPAVILEVEADERLYTAWEHPRVDEYPQALNLDEVRSQLTVPEFLREVHERNQAGALQD